MTLPDKQKIDTWICEPVVLRLMSENRWSRKQATQWFQDFMRWLYTCKRCTEKQEIEFMMDGLTYLDDVWHAYILHTELYFEMSKTLFGQEYIHHRPGNPFITSTMPTDMFETQLMELLADWGEDYIDRVYAYGADISDISDQAGMPTH